MPFRLLLSVVLVAMATAVLLPGLEAYLQTEVERRIQVTVAEVEAAARSVHHHPGSSRTVLVDVPPAGNVHMERLVIGGSLWSPPNDTAVIRWRHSAGGEGQRLVETASGPLPMAGPDGQALVVGTDRCLLVVEAKAAPRGSHYRTFVEVRAL